MRKMKSLVLAVMGLLCCMSVSAEDFAVDGIYYNITTDKTVAVTYQGNSGYEFSDEYSGNVKIPESVTFDGNTYSVTSIGYGAFYGCSSLTSVEMGNSVTSIDDEAFAQCSSLTSVEMGNSVTSIGDYAFYNCYSLTSVELPNSVTSIGEWAFKQCSSLTSVEIPNSVTSIGFEAFYGTAWYNNQPDGVIYAGKVLYKYKGTMPANTSITIEDGTVSISIYAFAGCSSLTSVEIPNSVTSIDDGAFYGCASLTSVEIPNSVKSIGNEAFWHCLSLTSVEMGNSVTSIGNSAFANCSSLTSVEMGNSVTSIGRSAFLYCINLKKLISYAEVPPICGNDVFFGVKTQECTLQVPEKSISAYQQADQWKEFLCIEDVPTAIGGVTVDGAVPATADVYSTNGMLVKRNADLKNLNHELPAGIYIIGGKKVYVR